MLVNRINHSLKISQIFIKTGIKKVRRASNAETGLTLSIRALKKLKKRVNLAKLNGLIYISQSPDSTIPPTSSLIHKKFKLPLNCFTMDIIQGCSSFPYAFFLASRYIRMGVIENCVILSAETYGKYIEKNILRNSYGIYRNCRRNWFCF